MQWRRGDLEGTDLSGRDRGGIGDIGRSLRGEPVSRPFVGVQQGGWGGVC